MKTTETFRRAQALLQNRRAKRASGQIFGSPSPSIFAGDPIEITEQQADALLEPAKEQAAVAAAATNKNDDLASQRVEAFADMTPTQKADVLVVPVLLMVNATITINPVTRPIPASVLNYNFLRCLTDFASRGWKEKTATPQTASANPLADSSATVSFNAGTVSRMQETGLRSVPAVKFTITASVLNAQPGNMITLFATGESVSGQTLVSEEAPFVIQRIDYVQAIMGIFVPFLIVATRSVPALAVYGMDGANEKVFSLTAQGLAVGGNEALIVVVPGYATAETKEICDLYNLPAGQLVR